MPVRFLRSHSLAAAPLEPRVEHLYALASFAVEVGSAVVSPGSEWNP